MRWDVAALVSAFVALASIYINWRAHGLTLFNLKQARTPTV